MAEEPPPTPPAPPAPAAPQPSTAVPQYAPPPGYVAPVQTPTNQLAVVSLVAGVASFVFAPIIGAVVAIITGHIARGQIKRTGEQGDGLALAGLIIGYVHLALVVLVFFFVVIVAVGALGLFAASRH